MSRSIRYDYAGPYGCLSRAWRTVDDLYAGGEISECEKADVVTRRGSDGKLRYYITLEDINATAAA